MDIDLRPTPGLLAAARRMAEPGGIVIGPEDVADEATVALTGAGLARCVFPPPRAMRDDYYTLTAAGRAGLARHEEMSQ